MATPKKVVEEIELDKAIREFNEFVQKSLKERIAYEKYLEKCEQLWKLVNRV